MKWNNGHIEVELPKKCKKITGTRFGSILGKNKWSSPFKAWCEITKTYEPPFEDTIYTIAGKTIEPKQIAYMKKSYYMTDLVTPTDEFGVDFFKKTYGDFYKNEAIFGGMWDSIQKDENGTVTSVLEFKTTKRAEDWEDNKVPQHYALQAALYAYLLNCEDVIMVCSILEEDDYQHPELYVPNASNTLVRTFKVHKYFPNFDDLINQARVFYDNHILTGISPDYDEKVDADYLKELRKNTLNPTTDINGIIKEIEQLDTELNTILDGLKDKQKLLDSKKKILKEYLTSQLREGDKQVELKGVKYTYVLSRSQTVGVDKTKLEKAGLFNLYSKITETIKLNLKENK